METLKKAEKIVLDFIIFIIIFAICITVYNLVQIKLFNKKYANFFGYTILEISTGSMADTLNIYDIIIVKITKDVKEEDIITFIQDEELITHRIIEINQQMITTKGDANNTQDKSISSDQIVGKVVFVFSKLGIWIKVISEPKVFISILITLLLIGKVFSKEEKI